MTSVHVGYLDFDGKIVHFRSARCRFSDHRLDVEAQGRRCRIRLYGIPFPEAQSIGDLSGKSFGPTDAVHDDPLAEGGIETPNLWLAYQSIEVRCRSYDADARLLTVWFQGAVADVETGRSGTVDSSLRCTIVETL